MLSFFFYQEIYVYTIIQVKFYLIYDPLFLENCKKFRTTLYKTYVAQTIIGAHI